MACLTRPRDGNCVAIADDEACAFAPRVIELLMTSHPHDCPVCDEGGECHLQDMTVMTGHVYRRYAYDKRTFDNQDLGPFVTHEMNRCIQCYRCLRFYADYAGGHDFGAFGLRNDVYFGRRATARWRASSAATSSRSARSASSTTRRSPPTTRASGTCRPRPPCARTAAAAATPSPASATASCAAC